MSIAAMKPTRGTFGKRAPSAPGAGATGNSIVVSVGAHEWLNLYKWAPVPRCIVSWARQGHGWASGTAEGGQPRADSRGRTVEGGQPSAHAADVATLGRVDRVSFGAALAIATVHVVQVEQPCACVACAC